MKKTENEQNTEKEWDDIVLRVVRLRTALMGLSTYAYYCFSDEKGEEGLQGLLTIVEEYAQNLSDDIVDKDFAFTNKW